MPLLFKSDSCDGGVVRTYEITRSIFHKKTARQTIEIDEYKNFGIGIWIDGWPQCAQSDSDRYHQALIHPGLIGRCEKFSAAILGGGDFCATHELIKYPNLSRVHIIDWDLEFIEIAKDHLEVLHHGAWQDSRVTVEIENPDVFKYLEKAVERYDFIFGDLTDLDAMDDTFPNFITQIKKLLNPTGAFISQFSEFPTTKVKMDSFGEILAKIARGFNYVWLYRTFIPSFGYEQAFLIASDSRDEDPLLLSDEKIAAGLDRLSEKCLEYSPAIHRSLFALSPLILDKLEGMLGSLSAKLQKARC